MLWAFNNERHAVGTQFIGHAQGKTSFNIHIWATAANLTERQKVRGKERDIERVSDRDKEMERERGDRKREKNK